MNNWLIVAVVLGAAVLAAVLVVALVGGPAVRPPEELLPAELAGFELVNRFDHVEPIFDGERYSSLVSFAPLAGVEFAGKVERMGITAYLFKDRKKAEAAEQVLLDSTGPGAEEVEIDGQAGFAYTSGPGAAAAAGLIWQIGPVIYQVFVTAPGEGEPDLEALNRAALNAAQAVLRLWKKG
ncbi:MAG: hypothetical protein NUW06_04885 [Candidatus Acetothermia bacterium]|jgi:hypothetical protein|nr:hypothetical protein [Candidatus Acetothermia bacterium]MDH7505205.1 hypothetical protein [Candidatus Acetothermia bacterium]